MTRASSERDFSDADVPTDADPSPPRRIILAQSEAPGGAAVVLFGPATVRGGAPDPAAAQTVSAMAAELGLPLGPPPLFSPDAYVVQSALGERLLTPPADRVADGDAMDPDATPGSGARRSDAWTDGHSAALLRSPIIALNYHVIEPDHRGEVEAMVRRVAALGPTLDPSSLDDHAPGPRIVVGFYDGYGFAGRFGADLCAQLGIRATFFPLFEPTDEPGCAELTDDELSDIAQAHEIGFHTSSHVLPTEVTPATLDREVLEPLRRIEAISGRVPRLAAWRGGARFDHRRLGDATLLEAGVRGMMSNWSVERIG